MKKSSIITGLTFVVLTLAVVIGVYFSLSSEINEEKNKKPSSSLTVSANSQEETKEINSPEINSSKVQSEENDSKNNEIFLPEITENKTVFMNDALFIGDSRTVGLMEYSDIKGADYFANTGMSVYNIYKKKLTVPKLGKTDFEDLITNKKYGKVYLMLGINELGYDFEKTVEKYKSIVNYISEKQPYTKIFIQANLHVTKKRSQTDKVINNKAIDSFNKAISEMADGKKIFYIDINPLFDDKEGNLASDKSADSAHPYAKYYIEWSDFIINQTAKLIKE